MRELGRAQRSLALLTVAAGIIGSCPPYTHSVAISCSFHKPFIRVQPVSAKRPARDYQEAHECPLFTSQDFKPITPEVKTNSALWWLARPSRTQFPQVRVSRTLTRSFHKVTDETLALELSTLYEKLISDLSKAY